ncbi:hypothetical protein C8F01DRAFT_30958 [Mycena amicta]|nr:hypothetical protein C8F01DRAFT_30958 [Mycena amicta]
MHQLRQTYTTSRIPIYSSRLARLRAHASRSSTTSMSLLGAFRFLFVAAVDPPALEMVGGGSRFRGAADLRTRVLFPAVELRSSSSATVTALAFPFPSYLSPHGVGLLIGAQGKTTGRRTIVETERSRDELLEAAARRLVRGLRVWLEAS